MANKCPEALGNKGVSGREAFALFIPISSSFFVYTAPIFRRIKICKEEVSYGKILYCYARY